MVEDIVYLIRELVAWLKGSNQADDEAVKAFLDAVHATDAYIADRTKHGEDRSREAELVGLWTECAVLFRHDNPNLALRLKDKARAWAVPDEYQHSDLERLQIQITEMREEADRLFRSNT